MADTTGPLAYPSGDHWPAGWVSPEAAEHAERQTAAWQLAQEAAAQAAREQAISDRPARWLADHAEPFNLRRNRTARQQGSLPGFLMPGDTGGNCGSRGVFAAGRGASDRGNGLI